LAPRPASLPNPALAAIPIGNQAMFRFFETRIDPFRDHDDSMPPSTLVGFYGRYCRQV
jgi:hypothetical protein